MTSITREHLPGLLLALEATSKHPVIANLISQARAASVSDDLSKQSGSGCSDERPCIPCFSDDGACQASAAPEQEPFAYGLTMNGESRQKLAEAQALLSDARGCVQDSANNANCTANERLYSNMLSDIDAFLSATAQPAEVKS